MGQKIVELQTYWQLDVVRLLMDVDSWLFVFALLKNNNNGGPMPFEKF